MRFTAILLPFFSLSEMNQNQFSLKTAKFKKFNWKHITFKEFFFGLTIFAPQVKTKLSLQIGLRKLLTAIKLWKDWKLLGQYVLQHFATVQLSNVSWIPTSVRHRKRKTSIKCQKNSLTLHWVKEIVFFLLHFFPHSISLLSSLSPNPCQVKKIFHVAEFLQTMRHFFNTMKSLHNEPFVVSL